MKEKVKLLCCSLLIIGLLFSYVPQASGQGNLSITAGIGLPELVNIGLKYQLNQTQIGLSIGSLQQDPGEKILSISSDIYLHVSGHSELTNLKPWYGRIGLNYLRSETKKTIYKYVNLNARLGYDFNLTEQFGIQIDGGALLQLHEKEIEKKPSNSWFDLKVPLILPGLGIGVFYRF